MIEYYEITRPDSAIKNTDLFYFVNSEEIFRHAQRWKEQHELRPARQNKYKVVLVGIDWQIDFCLREGALSLFPQSKIDIEQFVDFIYRNAKLFTQFLFTLDSHKSYHIFSPVFWLDKDNNHPNPYTQITRADLLLKKFRVNPEMAYLILGSMEKLSWLESYVLHYVATLESQNNPPLVIWPLHCEIASAGNLLVPAIYEAIHYVSYARYCPINFDTKATEALTESYGPFMPEVRIAHDNTIIGTIRTKTLEQLFDSDILILSGEAKSHCLKAAVEQIQDTLTSSNIAKKPLVYILSCTSNVPGFEAQGDKAFDQFKSQGLHIVSPQSPVTTWPNIPANLFST